ncbi:hypothetical protein EG68_08623 [Paragonimus skrjabini miyazakii]|uniref:Dual specificity protein phosphatase 14 n=1 Tax=Paragonimus skrjabini miyazakii TaxID=59628 RepID=A0A8S9YIS1_9TREM|nr:hypothetical protein EG68_08623 [Paragonimus skrjabini miyazakii]
MSVSRSQGDRGPPDSHVSERFSTTYSASYRPFEELQRNVHIRCIPGFKPPYSLSDGIVSSSLARGSRNVTADGLLSTAPLSSTVTNNVGAAGTYPNYQPSISGIFNHTGRTDSVGVRRPWDSAEPITVDSARPKPPGMCTDASVLTNRSSTASEIPNRTVGNLPFSFTSYNTKNYANTFTTTVASDKLSPCYSLFSESNCDKAIQVTDSKSLPLYCASQPRTLPTTASTLACSSKTDNFTSPFNKKDLPSIGNRNLTVTSVSPYQLVSQFDFGQMFSQIARINNHLYLSSLNALTPDRLRQHGITLLISAMMDAPPAQLRNAVSSSMHVAVEDMEGANIRVHFDRVSDRIAAEHRRGGRTLVHCMAGVSRSSSLILAYLMRHMNMSLAEAYQHVRSIRPCIQPNPSFWRQLLEFEERLRGVRSVRLLPPVGYIGSYNISSTGRMHADERSVPRSSYLDLYSRPAGDLLPYRPLTSLHSLDSGKSYIRCRQHLG